MSDSADAVPAAPAEGDGGRDHDGETAVRRPLFVLFLLTALMSLGYGGIFTLLADIRDRFGFGDADVGLIAFAGFATGFASQVLLARYADRGHTALMLRAGVATAAVGMLGMVVATELWAWVGARLLIGLGSGTVGPAVRRLVIARDPERIGANLGTQTAFDVTGFVLGPLLAAVLAELIGLRAPFVALAALYAVTLVVLLRLDLEAGEAGTVHRAVRQLVARPAVQSALCAAVAFYLTIGMFEALWSVLLRDLGAATWLTGLTLSLFTIPMIVFAPKGGALAQSRGPIKVVSVSIVVAAACTASYGLAPLWVLIAASGVHAVADAFTLPSNQVAVAVASPPDQLATGQGLLGATGLAVAGLAALIGAGVYEAFGRDAVFLGTAALMVLFLLVARWRWAVHARTAPVPA
jgi:DHA1 family multidrug resistance protein-like MFS transporter